MGKHGSRTATAESQNVNTDLFSVDQMAGSMYATDYQMGSPLSPLSPSEMSAGWTNSFGSASPDSYLQHAQLPAHFNLFFGPDQDSCRQSLDIDPSDDSLDQEMYAGRENFDMTDMTYSVVQRERRKAQNRANQRAYRERKTADLKKLQRALTDTKTQMQAATTEKQQLEKKLQSLQDDYDRLCDENELLRTIAQLQKLGKLSTVGVLDCRL